MAKVPRWLDEDAVYAYVENEMDGPPDPDERWDTVPPVNVSALGRAKMVKVIEAAKQGDFGPLHKLTSWPEGVSWEHLPHEARELIRAKMINKAPKRKGKLPKWTEEQKRDSNPLWEARDLLPQIEAVLRDAYPREGGPDHRDRAMAIAERMAGVAEPHDGNKLVSFINREGRKRP